MDADLKKQYPQGNLIMHAMQTEICLKDIYTHNYVHAILL